MSIRQEPYDCPVLQTTVTLTIETKTNPDGIEQRDSFFSCNCQKKCGVVEQTRLGINYHWEKCPVK